jgi:hypothetical protein
MKTNAVCRTQRKYLHFRWKYMLHSTFIVCILLCVIQEKYKWDSQHNKLLKPKGN